LSISLTKLAGSISGAYTVVPLTAVVAADVAGDAVDGAAVLLEEAVLVGLDVTAYRRRGTGRGCGGAVAGAAVDGAACACRGRRLRIRCRRRHAAISNTAIDVVTSGRCNGLTSLCPSCADLS
jgi:hypothetical protein